MVDIAGIDKIDLLFALWQHQKPAAFFRNMIQMAPKFDSHEAGEAIKAGYIDYFCGRCIKTDISEDTADPHSYDRDAGAGTFAKIAASLKSTAKPNIEPLDDSTSDIVDTTKQSTDPMTILRAYSDDALFVVNVADESDDDDARAPWRTLCRIMCPDNSGREFRPYGDAMIPGNPGTVLCGNCPMWLNQHHIV